MQSQTVIKGLIIICLVEALAYGLLYSAHRIGEISWIELVIQSQVVLTAFLGVVFFKDWYWRPASIF